ncbi:hypothetical protein [Pseudonocardia sp.]|uniref:hypothetical protein n=1 Tax=Pseudonocardia sp. TaxID=60912 RepID=UPI003D0DD857
MAVDRDGEAQPVLVGERAQRDRGHRLVVLEDGVQPEHDDVVGGERARDPQRLRK